MKYYRYFNGEESEVAAFDDINPSFFFLNLKLTKFNQEDGSTIDEPLFVPVVKKVGKYFICAPQKKCPLYEVDDPHWLFFTAEGHQVLLALVGASYCKLGMGQITVHAYRSVHAYRYEDLRPRRMFCVPEQVPEGSYPFIDWNRLR